MNCSRAFSAATASSWGSACAKFFALRKHRHLRCFGINQAKKLVEGLPQTREAPRTARRGLHHGSVETRRAPTRTPLPSRDKLLRQFPGFSSDAAGARRPLPFTM